MECIINDNKEVVSQVTDISSLHNTQTHLRLRLETVLGEESSLDFARNY